MERKTAVNSNARHRESFETVTEKIILKEKRKMKKKMNKKKATLLLLMTGILAASLTACQSKKDDSGKTKIEEGSKAMGGSTDDYLSGSLESEASYYKQALESSISIHSTNADEGYEEMYMSDFPNHEVTPLELVSFSYLDLDEDGKNEVVVGLDNGDSEILKEIDGTVYGYYCRLRNINTIYEDGTILGTPEDGEYSIYRLQLSTTGSTAEIESLGYEAGDSKTETTWYDFTDENIENVFGAADLYGDDSYEDDDFYSSTDANSDAYIQVLNNYDSFKDVNSGGEDVYLNEYAYEDEYTEDPLPYTINKFTYLDLDEDSENEVVLEMDYGLDGAYAVLKEIDGTIYGYDFNYRSINPLYADGTIMGSNGAANNELYRLEFTTDGALENLDAGIDTTASTKTPATWYDFTDENIDKIIGGASQETSQTSSQGTSQTGSQGTSQNASLGSLMTINQKNDGYVFNHTNEEYLSEDKLAYIPTEILRIARNEIYARHGYQFTSDMKTFFENKTWYNGTVPASQWSDSKLNTYEKKNVQLIQKYENLGAKVPFTTSSAAGGTQINGDGFTLTLPSEWNSSNYFATKGSSDDCDYYTFYSKNNYAYGYGGILFSIFVYDGPAPADARYGYDGFGELGNDGSHYYYMGGPTDIQWAPDISALESEYMSLYNTFDEIKSSFKKM